MHIDSSKARPQHIVHIEDNLMWRNTIANLLSDENTEVTSVPNRVDGDRLLDDVKAGKRPLDFLILDGETERDSTIGEEAIHFTDRALEVDTIKGIVILSTADLKPKVDIMDPRYRGKVRHLSKDRALELAALLKEF